MQKTSRGHPYGQKSYQVWIKEKEEEELKKFKKNISQFFDPSFVILDDAFYEKPETPPSLLTHSISKDACNNGAITYTFNDNSRKR